MNALILAAGFGTRMGAISNVTAKPLLTVAGKTVADHLVEKLLNTGRVDSITVISNHFYIDQFREWERSLSDSRVSVIDDGAMNNETRLGAIADMALAIRHAGGSAGPLFVMAGDNLYEFDFALMIAFQESVGTDVVAAYRQPDIARLRKTGVASLGPDGAIIDFEEKPQEPKSEYAVPCLYILKPETLSLIGEYIAAGNNSDAPGHFIKWLHTRVCVRAFLFDSPMYGIGDIESYEKVRKRFESND